MKELIESGEWECRVDMVSFEKVCKKLKNIEELLIESGVDKEHSSIIVGHIVFLPPIDALDSSDLDSLIINYSKYIGEFYRRCLKKKLPLDTTVDLINNFPFIADNNQQLKKWQEFDEFLRFLLFQLEMRFLLYDKLVKVLDRDLVNGIIGKVNMMIDYDIYQQAKGEVNKIMNAFCLNIVSQWKILRKHLQTDHRFKGTIHLSSLVLMAEDDQKIIDELMGEMGEEKE